MQPLNYLHYCGLNPIYIPVGEGYCLLTWITTEVVATLPLPYSRWTYISKLNCLLAALPKEDVLVSSRSFLKHSSSTSGCRHSFFKMSTLCVTLSLSTAFVLNLSSHRLTVSAIAPVWCWFPEWRLWTSTVRRWSLLTFFKIIHTIVIIITILHDHKTGYILHTLNTPTQYPYT